MYFDFIRAFWRLNYASYREVSLAVLLIATNILIHNYLYIYFFLNVVTKDEGFIEIIMANTTAVFERMYKGHGFEMSLPWP